MKRIKKLDTPIYFRSYGAVCGYEERMGPLGKLFDLSDTSDRFGMRTYEISEGEMCRQALNIALSKACLSHTDIELLIAGDLQNQCMGTSVSLDDFGIPFFGIYGACSTCTEGLAIMSGLMESGAFEYGAVVTSSHNSAAERQFRTPLEYGALRSPSAQWTSTAAGAFILSTKSSCNAHHAVIREYMAGRIVDGALTDGANMGAAMSFAAADTILSYFEESELKPRDFDYIVTGDLGRVGSDLLRRILDEKLPTSSSRHLDCGLLLYDTKGKDVHAGASGCGTSASVLATYFLPKLEDGTVKRILFLSTGALMSPSSVLQGINIKGIAPLIRLEGGV